MGLDINFYNYFLETAIKIIMQSLAEKRIQKNYWPFEGPPNLIRQTYLSTYNG